jgi:uncharacterized protein
MTPEERQMLGGLFQRVNSAAATQRDSEAESFISDAVRAAPHAPYVLAQTVLVQQQALEAAANRISELEAQGPEQSQEQGSFLGNLGKTIFGGGPSAPQRPGYDQQAYPRPPASSRYAPQPPQGYPSQPQGNAPPPQGYPPQQAGPWGQPQPASGGSFLQNAASTATGVAGGVVLGNLLGGLFGGHGGGLFGGGASAAGLGGSGLSGGNPAEITEINNYYGDAKGGGAGNADFQGFDPGAPGVQDANFDQLDDSSFDGSDGSSFDDGGGGGFDDV